MCIFQTCFKHLFESYVFLNFQNYSEQFVSSSGQKTCLHLHGIFPYLYVPYDGYGHLPDHYLRSLAFSIDRALNVTLGNPSSSVQHVFKVSLVYGM